MRLLDFGAGTGTYALAVRDLGYEISCVEPDEVLGRRLTALGFPVVRATTELASEDFDVIYTFNVLEHVADDRRAFRELYRLVSPGGCLLAYVPAFPILYSSMDRKVGHLRRYKIDELVQRVSAEGFRVDSCRYVDSLGFLASLVYRAVGSREGRLDRRAVWAYDSLAFPVSRRIDRVTSGVFGKNLALVAYRPEVAP